MEKVSIIFPVYKNGKVVEAIETLQQDPYPNKEFIVVVSSPEKEFLEKLNRIKKLQNVKLIIHKERTGKINAVHEAVEYATGSIFIFFDADIVPAKFNIEEVVKACKEYELVEFVKVIVPENIIGKLMHIEYFGYFGILQVVASKIKKSILLNGAGFAVRREVWEKLGGYRKMIIEDVDFATRVYLMGGRYHLLENAILWDDPVPNWRKWIDQRKRWAYGGVEWFVHYPKTIILFSLKHPLWLLAYIVFLNPAILLYLLMSLIPQDLWYNLALSFLIILSTKFSPLLFFILPLTFAQSIIKGFIFFFSLVVMFLVLYEIVYKIRWKKFVNPLWILGYVLIYSPLWLLIIISMILHYIIFERPPKMDWKI